MTENLNPIIEGGSAFMNFAGQFDPMEYTGYAHELMASKESAYLGTALNISPIYDIKGPDALRFLSSICVNNFKSVGDDAIRHAVICNEKGQIMTDGVVMRIAPDTYRTYWLQPVIDFHLQKSGMDVEGNDVSGQEFFYQLAGPKSLEILEAACGSDFHDLKFAKHKMTEIAGTPVRVLRLGMAGTLAYELHGAPEKAVDVYNALWEAGQAHGIRKMGRTAYTMNHTEAGFPNIMLHYPMPWYEDQEFAAYLDARPGAGYFNMFPSLHGSVGDDREVRYVTPHDVGWSKLIKYDHEFIGRKALEEQKDSHRQVVTLEWNADDVGEVFASMFSGRDVDACENIGNKPNDIYADPLTGFMVYRADKVLANGKTVGIATGRIQSPYYRRMISLAFLDQDYAKEGTELTLIWGTPGTPQKEIRVKVARYPYIDLPKNQDLDVSEIPKSVETA